LKAKGKYGMGDSKIEGFMKKHPPWFTLDIHPIRFAKKLSEGEQQDKRESEAH